MLLLLLLACTAAPTRPAETCNGRDDDRDGRIDEDIAPTWFYDADGDGFGTAATAFATCTPPDGWVAAAGDCDDGDPTAFPGATEGCGGGDEDCDGVVDPDGAEGCVDTWPDADGDGLGEGDPTCVCAPAGVLVGGDCDGADVDRGADCSEGVVALLDGVRLLDDDPDRNLALVAAGPYGEDGVEQLALWDPDGALIIAAVPTSVDLLVSDARLATLEASTAGPPTFGDLDGDGLPDLLAADAAGDPLVPTLTYTPGPLAGAPAPAWVLDLDPLTAAGYLSSFVADLDGDDTPEAWMAVGSSPTYPGETGVWRVDAAGAVTVLALDAESAGHDTLLTPLGDLDGDGYVDLGRLAVGSTTDTLAVHRGPIDALPDVADADATLTTPALADVVALGDLDGDGRDELGLRGESIWLLGTSAALTSGRVEDLAGARIGAEADDLDQSALFVAPGPAAYPLLVTDTFWPARDGAGNLRGALYAFAHVPVGVVDVRAADLRVYGEGFGLFGAFPTPLADGRLAVGANLLGTEVGTGVTWILDLD